ncbi:MAG: TonB-dependent receptor [Chitinophagaceae bacterium]
MSRPKILLFIVIFFLPFIVSAQITTSNISGIIKSQSGEVLNDAIVKVTHVPTGSIYNVITTKNGRYFISNLQPGGPYTIEVSYVGFGKQTMENIYLNLGETSTINFDLINSSQELNAVIIAANRRLQPIARGGIETVISPDRMQNSPSVGRNLADYFRLIPQARTTFGGGISIAGQNNRYNQLMIDGAVNNDVFGLSDQGTNGGQTGAPPISIDAIESMQIGISPYDVSLGNFTGGSINAITKSGTNNLHGSVYFVYRDQNISGKTPTGLKDSAIKLPDFTNKTYGFTLGGPILKNELFYFISGEILRNETPQPFAINSFKAPGVQDSINLILQKLNSYDYNPGDYLNIPDILKSDKATAKITWNINAKNRLNISYRYTKSQRDITSVSTSSRINFFNNGYIIPSTTNSASLEFISNPSIKTSNRLLLTYTKVFDDRNPLGQDFPRVTLNSINGTSYVFGSENFSVANQLKQNNIALYDEFRWNIGSHQLKAGVDNEFSRSYNLFIRDGFGNYSYNYVNDFLNDYNPSSYSRSFSLVDKIVGDGSKAAPTFNTLRLGIFLGDEWNVNENFKLNFGFRIDNFDFLTRPNTDTFFNNKAATAISQYWDLQGARSGEKPKANISFSPRAGFTYFIPDENLKLRGGLGLFTGRVPLVWPGGVYNNSGTTIGGVFANYPNITFRPDPYNQYSPADLGQTVKIPSGEIDLIAPNFKLPKILKTSLGMDKNFGKGYNLSVDLLYQKNINEVIYYNYLGAPAGKNSFGEDVYLFNNNGTLSYNKIDMDVTTPGFQNPYSTGIFLITNAKENKGFSYNASVSLDKYFSKGFSANVSYSYGDSYVLFDGTSSQNSSQWRFTESSNGRNDLSRSRSDFAQLHHINAFVSKKFQWAHNALATTISLFYNGQSGTPYSYVYSRSLIYDYNGSSNETTDLIYVPKDLADWQRFAISYIDANGTTISTEQQWNALNAYIENDKYLNGRRGQFAERNGAVLPFSNQIDLQIKQDFIVKTKQTKNNFTIQFDMFNFSNFLNRNWGRVYVTPAINAYALINMEGYTIASDGTYQPKFTYRNLTNSTAATVLDVRNNAYNSSRWRGQLTLRYSFY